jgi:glycine/D-amino acid oxidase-like deaminating enzyme
MTSDPLPSARTDSAIIGTGVMGAMLAERLSGEGRQVLLLDRRPPAHGSTAASTALVMWAADVPLTRLGETVGTPEAARRWRRVFAAVAGLAKHIDAASIECGRIDRPELYLAGTLLGEAALEAEGAARRAAGLPSDYLDSAAVAERFDIAPRAALLSAGSYEVDPVRLTLGLLARARARGAAICFPFDVVRIEQAGAGSVLHGTDGQRIEAAHVILASGYERASWFPPAAFGPYTAMAGECDDLGGILALSLYARHR